MLAGAGAAVTVAARTVEVTDKRLPGTIYTVAEHITSRGGQALPVRLDVRDPESIEGCVQRTVDEFGRVDIIVNNAAILVPGRLESVQPRHLDLIWPIDLRGPLLLMRGAAAPSGGRRGAHHQHLLPRGRLPRPRSPRPARWICEQPPADFTGNILFDEDMCREHGLAPAVD